MQAELVVMIASLHVVNANAQYRNVDRQSPDLTGDWRSGQGGVFSILDTGTEVYVWLKSSQSIVECDGMLVRNGRQLQTVYFLLKQVGDRNTVNIPFAATVNDRRHISITFKIPQTKPINAVTYTQVARTNRGVWSRISNGDEGMSGKYAQLSRAELGCQFAG